MPIATAGMKVAITDEKGQVVRFGSVAGGAYESGWQAGFNDCNSSYGRIQNTIHLFFAPS